MIHHHPLQTLSVAGIAAAALFAAPVKAEAAVIVSFDADSAATAPDPMSPEGGSWVARRAFPNPNTSANAGTGAATPPTRTAGQEVINGTTYNYITFSDPSSTALGALAYDLAGVPALAVGNTTGWTATVTARVLRADVIGGRAVNYFRVFANGRENYIVFINDPVTEQQGFVFWKSSYSTSSSDANYFMNYLTPFDISSDYLTYQLYYDPSSEATSLYINGSLISTIAISDMGGASSNLYSAGLNRAMEWGKATANGNADTHWNEVRFETGFAVIPEPSTFALVGAGLLGAALLRRKNRRG